MQLIEREVKHQRIVAILDEFKLDQIVLRKSPNTAWFSGGRVHVPNSLDSSCLDIIISRDGYYFHSNSIEAPRLSAEELLPTDDVRAHPWWISRDSLLPTGSKVGSDIQGGDRVVIPKLDELRFSLTEGEVTRLNEIATDAASALFNITELLSPKQTEIEIAGLITNALWQENLECVFLGVAGSDRVRRFRHPLPTTSIVGNQVSISICARRKGLIASETRIVSFETISKSRESEYLQLLQVESKFLDLTKTGNLLSDAFKAGASEYVDQGFASNEWHHHHQGGFTGYLPREIIANADLHKPIEKNQAVSWNPTALGLKAESTWLATTEDVKKLGSDELWPQVEINGRLRPRILELN